ncbi:hypothetical protein SB659_18525 [Arthrobacter sp. SIMBA_036]
MASLPIRPQFWPDALAGWWRADSVAGLVIVYDAVREALTIFRNVR